jgi:peptidoglycan hydrolase-like protein with peptidoglycan-binding domain
MPLQSRTFAGDPALEACLVDDAAHVLLGARGDHVAKIQAVVMFLDGSTINADEVRTKTYGPSTAAAVLAYKQKRNIVNFSYQSQADDIVGKMTIRALDNELLSQQADHAAAGGTGDCQFVVPVLPAVKKPAPR